MPFTFAHPAIILPLKYLPPKWVSLTALIVGSVIPDAEAYIRMYSRKGHSHSLIGFLLLGIPFGLLLTFVFHYAIRNPLIDHLPSFLYRRYSSFKNFDWKKRFRENWPVVVVSMVIGGASHFLWDSFSHYDGWLLQAYPQLKGNIFLWGWELEIPFLIQYISTLFGIVVIIGFVPPATGSKNTVGRPSIIKFWAFVVVVAAAIFTPRRLRWEVDTTDDRLVALISAIMLSLILACLVFERQTKPGNSF